MDIKYCDICGCVVKTTKKTYVVPETMNPFKLRDAMEKMLNENNKAVPRFGMSCDACDECWQDFEEVCRAWEQKRRKITEGKRWQKQY